MIKYLVSRTLQGIVTILIATVLVFGIMSIAPGDPIIFIVGAGSPPPPEIVAKLRAEYGLDKSVWERLLIYVSKVITGDLGYSYIYGISVANMILSRLPATIMLAMSAYILTTLLGILIGMVAARRPLSIMDRVITFVSTALYSIPSFFAAQLLLLVFSVNLKLLPVGGFIDPKTPSEPLAIAIDIMRHLVLPLASLTVIYLGLMIRVARTSIVQVMQEDFITTLRAIGFSERRVLRSAVKVASIPIITMANYELAFLLSGALLVEMVFSWPGMGTLLYDSILRRDYPMVSGIFFTVIGFSVLINFITDLMYLLLDPRIRLGGRA